MDEVSQLLLNQEVHMLVVGPDANSIEKLQEMISDILEDERTTRTYFLQIHATKTILEVELTMISALDYVVLIIDAKRAESLDEAIHEIKLLGPNFGSHKICLIATDCNYSSLTKPTDIWQFATFHQTNVIMSSLQGEDKLKNVGKRILNFMEQSCGLFNGIPHIGRV